MSGWDAEECSAGPTGRMSVFSRLNLEPRAKDVESMVEQIRPRFSNEDRKRLVSSAYMISFWGGRPSREIPQMDCRRRMPMGSMLKVYRRQDRGSPCLTPRQSLKVAVATIDTDLGPALRGDVSYHVDKVCGEAHS
jgi:hypothetical protein